jgi:hypothetical protein
MGLPATRGGRFFTVLRLITFVPTSSMALIALSVSEDPIGMLLFAAAGAANVGFGYTCKH